MPSLTTSLRWTTPSAARRSRRRRAACRPRAAIASTIASSSAGTVPPLSSTQRRTESAAPLRIVRPSRSTPLIRVCAVNGTTARAGELALAQAVALLGEHDDRATLRRLVGEARELRGLRELLLVDPGEREELGRLAVAERDRAGLVEQQRRAVAGGLDRAPESASTLRCTSRSMPGDADRGEQRADRRRDQADEQRDEDDRWTAPRPSRSRTAAASRPRAGR